MAFTEKVITVVTPAQKKALLRIAAKQDRSLGAVARLAFAAYIERESK